MNDPAADADRRDRMAVAAAQYVHAKRGADGLKEGKSRERAVKAAAAPAPSHRRLPRGSQPFHDRRARAPGKKNAPGVPRPADRNSR